MKIHGSLLAVFLLSSCAQWHTKHDSSHAKREVAQVSNLARQFLDAAFQASTKEAKNTLKSVDNMESLLLKEVKQNPSRFGLDSEAAKGIKSLDNIKEERILAEILSEAGAILGFNKAMREASSKAIAHEAAVASRVSIKAIDAKSITLTMKQQTGLGQENSWMLAKLKSDLIDSKMVSATEADIIYSNLLKAAQDLNTIARKASKEEVQAQLALARQIVEYSAAITRKTGREFLGNGGCLKISGKDVLGNKAEIAYKVLKDVEEQNLKSYDDISEALVKRHSEITNRTAKESCFAITELTSGASCGKVYSPKLKPHSC